MGYGQYSEGETAGKRWTLEEQKRFYPFVPHNISGVDAGAGARLETIKRVGHNRALLTFSDGTQGFMLHSSVIAWRVPHGKNKTPRIRLDWCGYHTITTRAAMGEALRLWTNKPYPTIWREKKRADGITRTRVNIGDEGSDAKVYEGDAFWLD